MTSAMVQVQLADGLSLVSGQWIKSAPLNSFDMNTHYGALGGFSGNLDGDVFKLVIKGVTPSAAAKSVKVSFTFKSGSTEVGTTSVSKNVIVACPGHSYGSWTKVDDNQHSQTCIHCGDVKKANTAGIRVLKPSLLPARRKAKCCIPVMTVALPRP